jgi:hypothetical protein
LLDDGAVGDIGLDLSHPGEGLVGAGSDVEVGEGSEDGVELSVGDGVGDLGVVEVDTGHDVLDRRGLANLEVEGAVQADTVLELLEPPPVELLAILVLGDELLSTEGAVNFESLGTVWSESQCKHELSWIIDTSRVVADVYLQGNPRGVGAHYSTLCQYVYSCSMWKFWVFLLSQPKSWRRVATA